MSRLKAIARSVFALNVLTWAGATLRAEEPAVLCCTYTSDCTANTYPICDMTYVDCDTYVLHVQGYCMAKPRRPDSSQTGVSSFSLDAGEWR